MVSYLLIFFGTVCTRWELSVPWRPDRISILPFGYDAFLRHFSLESFLFPSWFFILFFSVLFLCEYIWGHWWVFVVGAGLCLQHMGSRMCGLSSFDVRDHSSPVRHWPRACCFGSLLLWELAALGAWSQAGSPGKSLLVLLDFLFSLELC